MTSTYVPSRPALPRDLLRLTAVVASLLAAAIHLAVLPEHWQEWWAYGLFFAVSGVAQLMLALLLCLPPRLVVVLGGIAGNVAIVVLYVVTRTVGVPFGPHGGAPEEVGLPDLVATGAELALVVALVVLLTGRIRSWILNGLLVTGLALWAARALGWLG